MKLPAHFALCIAGALRTSALEMDASQSRCMVTDDPFGDGDQVNCLSRNLKTIPSEILQGASRIRRFFLSFNRISSVDQLSGLDFPLLRNLDLKKNNLSDLSPLVHAKTPNLSSLDISDNRVADIDFMQRLQTADEFGLLANNNKIANLCCIPRCKSLAIQGLLVANNSLENIDCLSEGNFPKLKYLDLSHNLLRNVGRIVGSMKTGPLRLLALKSMNLESLDFLTRVDLGKVTLLFDGNKLSRFPDLRDKNVRHVSLEDNPHLTIQSFACKLPNATSVRFKGKLQKVSEWRKEPGASCPMP